MAMSYEDLHSEKIIFHSKVLRGAQYIKDAMRSIHGLASSVWRLTSDVYFHKNSPHPMSGLSTILNSSFFILNSSDVPWFLTCHRIEDVSQNEAGGEDGEPCEAVGGKWQ